MNNPFTKENILILSPQKTSNPNWGAFLLENRFKLLAKDYNLFLIAKDAEHKDKSKPDYLKKIKLIKKTKIWNILRFFYRYIVLTNIIAYWRIFKYNIKIVQIEYFDCLPYSFFLFPLKLIGVKILYTAHDIQSLYYPKKTFKYQITKYIEKYFLKLFIDNIFVRWKDDKNELISWNLNSNKIVVIPPIIDYEENISWKLNNITNFVFMGSYSHKPNRDSLEVILRIRPEIKKHLQYSKLYLIIGGNINIDLNDDSIINCGFVERPEDILDKCNIFLAPIISGTGIKVKIIEAFKFGIPLISTPLGFRNFDDLDKNIVPISTEKLFLKTVLQVSQSKSSLLNISKYEQQYFIKKFSNKNINIYKTYY